MNDHRVHVGSRAVQLLVLIALLDGTVTSAAAAAANAKAVEAPDGVVFQSETGMYRVARAPTRSLGEVMKSFSTWQHQQLADGSAADYSAEDGILAMECAACGLSGPTAIELKDVDLESIIAYEAGAWRIGLRSKDGTQDFLGVLRGELGPQPHDPVRKADNQRIAMIALRDLHDLAYLAQGPGVPKGSTKDAGLKSKADKKTTTRPTAASALADLAASGNVEGIQALQGKANSREVLSSLEAAYAARARNQMLAGQLEAALETLSAGRRKFGKSVPLRDLEAQYVVVGEAHDRLRLAVRLNVEDLRDYLHQIQTLGPSDATLIEQMLARTLGNRIADQRAAGRTVIANDLLNSGQDLFPVWTAELAHGQPGMLPNAGVAVETAGEPSREQAR